MTIYGGPDIVTNGLVLHLDAGNNKSYPGSGTVWTDLSGNGNNGTLINGPSYSSSNKGNIVFDGTNDYIQLNYTNSSSVSQPFSLCVWYYLGDSSGSAGGFLIGNAKEASPWDGVWFTPGGGGRTNKTVFALNALNSAKRDINATNAKTLNKWYYLVGIYDGSSNIAGLKIYENSISVATSISQSTGTMDSLPTRQWRIGVDTNNLDWLKGNIGAVQIYNRSLSANEVSQNYNATKGRFGL